MEIEVIHSRFSVCKVEDFSSVRLDDEFCFIGKTDEECSVVCITEHAPPNTIEREDGWRAFRIRGMLDFSLIGILSRIACLLAENQISIFAVSTYNTDYILTNAEKFDEAIGLLKENGYLIV